MPTLTGFLLAVSSSLAASIAVKATVAAGLALLGTWLARRSRAAVRHAMLAAAFAALLLLPVASLVTPPVRIAVPAGLAPLPFLSLDRPIPPLPAVPEPARLHDVPAPPPRRPFSPSALLLPAWALGVALSLLPMVLSWWKVRVLRRSALPWRVDAGLPRRIELSLHEAVPGPMTCGVLNPAIVLPMDAPSWPADHLKRALVHEMAHVRRGDWVSHCLARLTCAVYWFHPLVWMAWRQLALEAERSCDDAVLENSEATTYADQLVGLAQRLSIPGTPHLAMANRSDLSARIGALLDGRQRRGRAGTLAVATTAAAAAALVFAISPLRVVAARQTQDGATLEFNAVSVKLLDANAGGLHSQQHEDPGRLSISGNLHRILVQAYGILDGQIGSEPEWFNSNLFAIEAVTSGPASAGQKMLMLRAVLADRFQLKLRQEERDLPVYTLEVAPGGPKFRELTPNEELPKVSDPPGYMQDYFTTMQDLTRQLTRQLKVDRPVIDRTNLTGEYNAHLLTVREAETGADGRRTVTYPDLFHDLQSQMGLKLVPTRIKMPFYVVEHAALPTPN